MAFDSVFHGPPSDVAAPGTKQSPSLGVDVTNKELYISSGSGWEELLSGGTGAGGTNGQLQYNDSGALAGAGLTDGSHFAMGVGAEIDSNPNDGTKPIALNVSEETTAAVPGIGFTSYRKWQPSTDAASFESVQAASCSAYINADDQAATDLQCFGVSTYVENDSAVRDVDAISGGFFSADQFGAGTVRHLFGFQSGVFAQHGTVSEDAIGVLSSSGISGDAHVTSLYGFYSDVVVVSDTALVDTFNGLHIHAPINTSSHPIGTFRGIQLDVATTAGTVTKAIDSTGNAPSDFAGPVKVLYLQPHTVYSAAGTALPAAATAGVGARAFVSDATVATFGTAYTGGGTNKVPVYSDGTAWHIG
jgi:hypothetical protein